MRKLIFILLFSISAISIFSQEIDFCEYYAQHSALGLEVTTTSKNIIYGVGYYYNLEVPEIGEYSQATFYIIGGHAINKLSVTGRFGYIKNLIYTNNNVYNDKIAMLIGFNCDYNIKDNFLIYLGYDTFNEIAFGFEYQF